MHVALFGRTLGTMNKQSDAKQGHLNDKQHLLLFTNSMGAYRTPDRYSSVVVRCSQAQIAPAGMPEIGVQLPKANRQK